jgi:hypothetical protein
MPGVKPGAIRLADSEMIPTELHKPLPDWIITIDNPMRQADLIITPDRFFLINLAFLIAFLRGVQTGVTINRFPVLSDTPRLFDPRFE